MAFFENLNNFQAAAFIASVISGSLIACVYLWTESKKPQKTDRGADIIIRVAVAGFLFSAILWLLYIMEVIPHENKNILLIITGAIYIGIGYMYWRYWVGTQPKPMHELLYNYAIPRAKTLFNSDTYKGEGDINAATWGKRHTYFVKGREKVYDVFFLHLTNRFTGVFEVLLAVDSVSGHVVYFDDNPESSMIYELKKKEPTSTLGLQEAIERFENIGGEDEPTAAGS